MSDSSDDVLSLGVHRHDRTPFVRLDDGMPPGDPIEKIEAILDRPDAIPFIKTLDPHALFRVIKEAGLDQGVDIIPYASPRQLQVFMDLDCWKKDRLQVDRLATWLTVMVADADDDHFHRALRDIDPEVIALFFKKNLQAVEVIEDEEEDLPKLPPNAELSPDNAYALVYPEDEDMAALMRALVDRLYHVDQGLAWTLFEAVRWELTTEMEEMAYKFRNGRLEEYGFVERTEALAVYAHLDPLSYRERFEDQRHQPKVAVDPPKTLHVPAVIADEVDEDFYFFEILNSLDDPELLERLSAELVALSNRAMLADGIEPGGIDAGQEVIRRSAGYLSLGLTFVARTDADQARLALQQLPLRDLFRVGYSITLNLQKKARSLEDRPTLSLAEGVTYSLLNPDETALFEGLSDLRPTFGRDAATFEIFQDQDQVDLAALRIGLVAFKQLWLFGVADQSVDDLASSLYDGPLLNDPDNTTFDAFFATCLMTQIIDDEPTLRGLTNRELAQIPHILRDAPWESDPLDFFEPVIGPMLVELPREATGLATRWLRSTLAWLDDELAAVRGFDGPHPYLEILLVASPNT